METGVYGGTKMCQLELKYLECQKMRYIVLRCMPYMFLRGHFGFAFRGHFGFAFPTCCFVPHAHSLEEFYYSDGNVVFLPVISHIFIHRRSTASTRPKPYMHHSGHCYTIAAHPSQHTPHDPPRASLT